MLKSKDVLNKDGKQFHLNCTSKDIGEYVLLPGDPERTNLIAQKLDNSKLIGQNRELRVWTGMLNDKKVSVVSTGMGGPSTAIAVEELIHCGAHTFIRVGTSGRVGEKSQDNKYIGAIFTSAIRDEGTSKSYVPAEYPAVANIDVINALIKATQTLKYNFLPGIGHSKESFYGEIDPESMPIDEELKSKWRVWQRANAVATEMESSTLFVISSIRGVRAGSICAYDFMNEETINVAIEAIKNLIILDSASTI